MALNLPRPGLFALGDGGLRWQKIAFTPAKTVMT
jgi:hypothetical protein